MPRVANANTGKKFVKIQSSQTIRVTAGLQYADYTKPNSDIPNRMKVAPKWPKMMVLIKQGQHTYPAEITEWETVKSLEASGVLTIGALTDNDEAGEAVEAKHRLDVAAADIKPKSLSDIAGD